MGRCDGRRVGGTKRRSSTPLRLSRPAADAASRSRGSSVIPPDPAELVQPPHAPHSRSSGSGVLADQPDQRLHHVPRIVTALVRVRRPGETLRRPLLARPAASAIAASTTAAGRRSAHRSDPAAAARSAPRRPRPPGPARPAPARSWPAPGAGGSGRPGPPARRSPGGPAVRPRPAGRPAGPPRPGWPAPARAAGARRTARPADPPRPAGARAAARSPSRISCQVRLFSATAMSRIRPLLRASSSAASPCRRASSYRPVVIHSAASWVCAVSWPATAPSRSKSASAAVGRADLLGARAVLEGQLRQPDLGPGPDGRVGVGGTRIVQQPPQPLPPGDVPPAEPPPARQRGGDPQRGVRILAAANASAAPRSPATSSSRAAASARFAPIRSGAIAAARSASTSACRRRPAVSSPSAAARSAA